MSYKCNTIESLDTEFCTAYLAMGKNDIFFIFSFTVFIQM